MKNSSNGLLCLLPVIFFRGVERICHLWLAQTVESHTLVKAGQTTNDKLC